MANYGWTIQAEPTEAPEEPTCGCSSDDFVPRDEFDELARTVRELQAGMGAAEADTNDVMAGLTEMASCMADVASRFDREEPTEAPEEPETTMEEEEKTTLEEEPETTYKEETTTMEEEKTTMMETEEPTEMWRSLVDMVESGDNSCSGNQRTFESTGSMGECVEQCTDDCVAVSYSEEVCYGCRKLNREKNGFTAYTMRARRRLSELEMLRAENEALKKELARRA